MFDAVIRRLALVRLRDETHSAIAVNVREPDSHTEVVSVMGEKERTKEELTNEELERQDGEPLPERTQMSLIQPGPPGVGIEPLPLVEE